MILLTELGQLSGVAAILRFPIPDDDEDSEEEGWKKQDQENYTINPTFQGWIIRYNQPPPLPFGYYVQCYAVLNM